MTQTVYGVVHNADGLVYGETRTTPAAAMADHQAPVAVDVEHDHVPRGRVIHLERSRHGDLWAVAEVDDTVDGTVAVRVGDEVRHVPHDLWFSSETVGSPEEGIAFNGWLSLTRWPALVGVRAPVQFLEGAADHSQVATLRWQLPAGPHRELLTRAARSRVERRARDPLYVYDCERGARHQAWVGRRIDEGNLGEFLAFQDEERRAARGRPVGVPIEHRPGGSIISVR